MGGWPSKASTTTTAATSTNAAATAQQQKQKRQRRERLLQTHGIFVPPAFAVSLHNNDDGDDPSCSCFTPARTQERYRDDTHNDNNNDNDNNDNDNNTAWRLLPHSQSCVAAAQHVDAGQRILQDYLQPGVWWQSVSSLQATTVLASLSTTTTTAAATVDDDDDDDPTNDTRKNAMKNDKNDTRNTNTNTTTRLQQQPYGGHILVAKQLSDNVTVRLQGSSHNNDGTSLPRWTGHWHVHDAFTVSASSDAQGQEGWLGGRYQCNLNRPIRTMMMTMMHGGSSGNHEQGIRIEAASIVPWHFQNTSSNTTSTSTSTTTSTRNNHHLLGNHVFLTGSLSPWSSSSSKNKMNGWKLAVDTKVQLDNPTWQTTDTRFYGSMYLQDQDDSSSSSDHHHNNNNNNNHNTNISPVELSFQMDSQQSAVALTQRLAFDRIQLNVLDNRAPLVRNTIGWTLRMEQPLSSSSSSNKKNSPKVTLGAVWQLNRATAIKAVWHNDQQSLTTALIGKRWKHPRVTCSVLGRYHVPTRSATWLGISLEVETGQFPPETAAAAAAAATDSGSSGSPPPPPPTQIQLPPGVKIDE